VVASESHAILRALAPVARKTIIVKARRPSKGWQGDESPMTDIVAFRDREDPECWRVEHMDYDGRTPLPAGTREIGRGNMPSGCSRGSSSPTCLATSLAA
jgi:hypothetical protein